MGARSSATQEMPTQPPREWRRVSPQADRGSTVFDPEAQTRRELAEVRGRTDGRAVGLGLPGGLIACNPLADADLKRHEGQPRLASQEVNQHRLPNGLCQLGREIA